jgi:hypothetical protein
MAVSAVVTVGTTATLLTPTIDPALSDATVTLRNAGAAAVFIGGPGVTTANGYTLAVGGIVQFYDDPSPIWGIVAAATQNVEVLRT